jgi:hypothetical protein
MFSHFFRALHQYNIEKKFGKRLTGIRSAEPRKQRLAGKQK